MIDEREIRQWIARLECEDSSWTNYARLAVLYAIQDHGAENDVSRAAAPAVYSEAAAAPQQLRRYGDSDFLRAVEGKDPEQVWPIMDELMDSLRVVNERVYNSVMRKLERVGDG